MRTSILFDDLIQQTDKIWVRNNTAAVLGRGSAGPIQLTCYDPNGNQSVSVTIPLGPAICLNDQVSFDLLKSSSDLRRMISRNILVPLIPTEIESLPSNAIMESRAAVEKLRGVPDEVESAFEKEQREMDQVVEGVIGNSEALSNPTSLNHQAGIGANMTNEQISQLARTGGQLGGDVHPRVVLLIGQLEAEEIKSKSFVEALQEFQAELDSVDIKAIRDATNSKIINRYLTTVEKALKTKKSKKDNAEDDDDE